MLTLLLLAGMPFSNDLDFRHLLGKPVKAFEQRIGKPCETASSISRFKNSYLKSLGIKSIDVSVWPLSGKVTSASPIVVRFDSSQVHDWKQAFGAVGFETSGVKAVQGLGSWSPVGDSLQAYLKGIRSTKPAAVPLFEMKRVRLENGDSGLGGLNGYQRGRWQWSIRFMPKAPFDGNDPEMRLDYVPKVY